MTKQVDDFYFEIVEHFGVLSTREITGWNKELNIVSWNGGTPRFDVRDWDPTHEKMSRGITLLPSHMKVLYELFEDWAVKNDIGKAIANSPVVSRDEYAINAHIGRIFSLNEDWNRELNIVSWFDNYPPKFDIRDWDKRHHRMSRGITLTEEEMHKMCNLYREWEAKAKAI